MTDIETDVHGGEDDTNGENRVQERDDSRWQVSIGHVHVHCSRVVIL